MSELTYDRQYLDAREKRRAEQKAKKLAEIDNEFRMENTEALMAPKAPAAPAAAAPAAPPADAGFAKETYRAVVGGPADAFVGVARLWDESASKLEDGYLAAREFLTGTAGEKEVQFVGGTGAAGSLAGAARDAVVAPSQSTVGKVGRSITQFVVPFLGSMKALGAAGAFSKGGALATATKASAAGAAADFAAFAPEEGRLTDLLAQWTKDNPRAGARVMEWFADRDPNSPLTERAKTAVEGLFFGTIAEGVFAGFRGAKAWWLARGKDPAEEIAKKIATIKQPVDTELEQIRANIEALMGERQVRDGAAAATAKADAARAEQAASRIASESNAASALDGAAVPKKSVDDAGMAAAEGEAKVRGAQVDTAGAQAKQAADRAAREGIAGRILAEADKAEKSASARASMTKAAKEIEPTLPKNAAELDVETVFAERRARSLEKSADEILVEGTRFAPTANRQNVQGMIDVILRRPGALRDADDILLLKRYAELAEQAEKRLIDDGVLPPKWINEGVKELDKVPVSNLKAANEAGSMSVEQAQKLAADTEATVTRVQSAVDIGLKGGEKEGPAGLVLPGRMQGGYASPALLAQVAAAGAGGLIGYQQGGTEGAVLGVLAGALGGAAATAYAKKAKAASGAAKASDNALTAFKNFADEVADTEALLLARDSEGITVKASIHQDPSRSPRISTDAANKLTDAILKGDEVAMATEANTWINWSHVDVIEDVAVVMKKMEAAFANSIKRTGSAVMGDKQVMALADAMGMSTKALKGLNEDVAALAPRLMAARSFELASVQRFKQLVDAYEAGGLGVSTEAFVLAARKQMHLAATARAYVKGSVSEVARALRQQRLTASASTRDQYREALEVIESLGGLDTNVKELKRLAQLELDQLANAAQKSWAARGSDAFLEMFVNGLLSGPITHTVNATSNLLVAVTGVSEKTASAALGSLFRKGAKDRVTMGEVHAQLVGMGAGIRDALRVTAQGRKALLKAGAEAVTGNFEGATKTINAAGENLGSAYRVFANNTPIIDSVGSGTIEQGITPAITSANLKLNPDSVFGRAVDLFGTLTRVPGKSLMTADEIFKTLHYRGQLHAQAFREAGNKGLSGQDFVDEMVRLLHDPTDNMRKVAMDEARYRTFTQELEGLGADVQRAAINHPVVRVVLPFVRTPVNIMKYSFERLGMSKQLQADIKAGGLRREVALGKLSTTAVIAAGFAQLQAEGLITGGGERQGTAEELARIPKYSIKVGDKWIDYSRMEPLATILGLMADGADIMGTQDAGEAELTATGIVATIARDVTSKTYLEGLVNFFDAIGSGDTHAAQKFVNQLAGGSVPFSSALATATREMDPEMKEAKKTTAYLKSRIPGMSEDVAPHRDIFGNPVHYRAGLGPDWLSPIRLAQESSSPAAQEIARLDSDLQRPSRTIERQKGVGVELTEKEYDKLLVTITKETKVGGKNLQEYLDHLVTSERYQKLPEEERGAYKTARQTMIEKAYEAFKSAGTKKFIFGDQNVRRRFEGNRQNALNALLGRPVVPLEEPAE